MADTCKKSTNFLLIFFFIAACALALSLLALPKVAQLSEVNGVEESLHAEWHGEAQAIRDTCNNNGVYQVWVEPDKITFHLLCKLEQSGKIGDRIVKIADGEKSEKTAFIPKDGTWNKVIKWLENKGATRFNGKIPGVIILPEEK
jgi:hypothetical protein